MTTRQMHEMTHRERMVVRRRIERRQALWRGVGEFVTLLVWVAAAVLVLLAGQL